MSTTMTDLEHRLSEAIARVDPSLQDRLESDSGSSLDLVLLTAEAHTCITGMVQSAVLSARTAGHSWDAIGTTLGMSRQAAQQRFGKGKPEQESSVPGTVRTVTGLTAFNEMDALDKAGTYGWHSIGFGPLFHTLKKSEFQWEHRRVLAFPSRSAQLQTEGWERIGSMWFPWAYFARPTDIPALMGAVSDEELLTGV